MWPLIVSLTLLGLFLTVMFAVSLWSYYRHGESTWPLFFSDLRELLTKRRW